MDRIFTNKQSREVIDWVGSAYGDALEFLWERFPDTAVFRRKDTMKWYGVMARIPARKIGVEGMAGQEILEVMNLHLPPDDVSHLIDRECFFPAWHMNKTHWVTVVVDGRIETSRLREYVKTSYHLAR